MQVHISDDVLATLTYVTVYVTVTYITAKMSRFKRAFKAFFQNPQVGNAQESARVRALNAHINTLLEINESQSQIISALNRKVTAADKQNMEERVIDAVIGMLGPRSAVSSPPLSTSSPQTLLESGYQLSDDDIDAVLATLPESQKKQIKTLPTKVLKTLASNMFPTGAISDETIEKAKARLKHG